MKDRKVSFHLILRVPNRSDMPPGRWEQMENTVIQSTIEQTEWFRSGQAYQGDYRAFVSASTESLDEIARSLRCEASATVRMQLVKLLVNLAVELDRSHLLRNPRILSILLDEASIRDDEAYRFALDRIFALTPPSSLLEYSRTLAFLASEAPTPELFLVIAKAKAIHAREAISGLSQHPQWGASDERKIACAALGDLQLESDYIQRFQQTNDPQEKIDLAKRLGWIGSRHCLKVLALEIRSPITYRISHIYEASIRPEIAKAIQHCCPEIEFLSRIESNDDYGKIEEFCQSEFQVQWKYPRPPFLTIHCLAK